MAAIAKLTANLELNSASFRKELDKADKKTKAFRNETKKANQKINAFERSMKGASQGVASFNGPLNGISGRISSVNSLLHSGTLMWGSLGAAVAGASLILAKSVGVYEKVEQEQLKTQALLKATEMAAGRTAAQLDAQARQVALNTLASTAGIRQAQQVLLTFRSVQKDTFDRAISLSQDMAAVMGGTAKSAALQLGKALESPTTGLTALRRSGVSFTEAEKEVIKSLEDTGRVAEAQEMILDKLAAQIGGAGAGAAGGLSGSADTLGQRWEEMLETLARTTGAAGKASAGLNQISDALKSAKDFLEPSLEQQRLAIKQQIAEVQARIDSQDESTIGRTLNLIGIKRDDNVLIHRQTELKKQLSAVNTQILDQFVQEEEAAAKAKIAREKANADFQAEVERKKNEAAADAARKQAEREAAEIERQNKALAGRIESIEVGHLAEQERLVFHFERRHEMISDAHEREVISDHRKNELIKNEAVKLNQDLIKLSDRRAKKQAANDKAEFDRRVGYFTRSANAMASIAKGNSNKLFKFSQDLALGQAAVSLPAAVIEAIKNGGGLPWGAAAGFATFLEGTAQIAAIRQARNGGGSSSSPSSTVGTATPAAPPTLESIAPGINDQNTNANQGTTIIFNGPVSSNDIPKLAEDLKEHIKVSDFVLITADSRNALELTA